jgi:hypothetical protein
MRPSVSRAQLAAVLRPVATAVVTPDDAQRQQRVNAALDGDGTLRPEALGRAAPRHVLSWYLSGTATVANNKGAELRLPTAAVVERLDVRAKTAPTGAALTARLRVNGVAGPTVSIAAAATSGGVGLQLSVAAGDVLTVDITAVGSGTAGADVTIMATYREAVQ